MKFCLLACLIAVSLAIGCSHSTDSSSTGPATDTTKHPVDTTKKTGNTSGSYTLYVSASEINAGPSTFDDVSFIPAGLAGIHMTGPKDTIPKNNGGRFVIGNLAAGDYVIHATLSGYAPTLVYASIPRDTGFMNTLNVNLYPPSWLKATIDSVVPDKDPSLGLNVYTHIETMDPTYLPIGTVYLYLSKTPSIDAQNSSSYDAVYSYEVGNRKDSVIREQIIPSQIHKQFAAGTTVFCTAYVAPYSEEKNYAYVDSTGKKVYPYLGKYPSKPVIFTIP